MLTFSIQARLAGGRARAGTIETPHGRIETPAFIPVGTKATVKALSPEQVGEYVGAQAILANTYHLYLQPGPEIMEKAGGLGKFMNWSGPTFTDSGGFQAFSLQGDMKRRSKIKVRGSVSGSEPEPAEIALARVDDDGVDFKSVIDGSTHRFTPEKSIEIQHGIGADIIFAFDECILPEEPLERQTQAVERTHEWAKRSLERHEQLQKEKSKKTTNGPLPHSPALFGIVQGGRHRDLRERSARQIGALSFDGFGIGGSFDKEDIGTAVGWVTDLLPEGKPRHLLGIGSDPADLILGIKNGIDTFDCVAPTRIARNGSAYIRGEKSHRANLLNARFTDDLGPLDPSCGCHICRNYSRAYISHLFRAKEMLAATLTSIHNLYFMVNLVSEARQAIIRGTFEEFAKEF